MRRETRDEIQQIVDRLTPGYRVPLILRYWYDLSYEEIADVMGLSVQAVKSRLHRARLQVAEQVPTSSPVRMATVEVR
jgi:RNA polymerase sigma-70 factor (ECF subfamily)